MMSNLNGNKLKFIQHLTNKSPFVPNTCRYSRIKKELLHAHVQTSRSMLEMMKELDCQQDNCYTRSQCAQDTISFCSSCKQSWTSHPLIVDSWNIFTVSRAIGAAWLGIPQQLEKIQLPQWFSSPVGFHGSSPLQTEGTTLGCPLLLSAISSDGWGSIWCTLTEGLNPPSWENEPSPACVLLHHPIHHVHNTFGAVVEECYLWLVLGFSDNLCTVMCWQQNGWLLRLGGIGHKAILSW